MESACRGYAEYETESSPSPMSSVEMSPCEPLVDIETIADSRLDVPKIIHQYEAFVITLRLPQTWRVAHGLGTNDVFDALKRQHHMRSRYSKDKIYACSQSKCLANKNKRGKILTIKSDHFEPAVKMIGGQNIEIYTMNECTGHCGSTK